LKNLKQKFAGFHSNSAMIFDIVRPLLMGMFIVMMVIQQVTAPKGSGRQKAKGKRISESSTSKAPAKSAARKS
jgi:hypothetical protein